MNKDTRIVFMGTPDFATGCLKKLIENNYNIVGVITVADKPAGRGKKMAESSVKKYATEQNLNVLQPTNLKDPNFLEELQALKANLFVVVAFRMLPEAVWKTPTIGTFNLHASLLPDYRGAAPINWAVINGDKKSGVTTFMIDEKIDTGGILLQEEVAITPDMSAGELHDELLVIGSDLILKTIDQLADKKITPKEQPKQETFKKAPKIFKNDCKINWKDSIQNIHNFIRGMAPYPSAWTELILNDTTYSFKIIQATMILEPHVLEIGTVQLDKKSFKIAVTDGFIQIEKGQLQGKKLQKVQDLINGIVNYSSICLKIS